MTPDKLKERCSGSHFVRIDPIDEYIQSFNHTPDESGGVLTMMPGLFIFIFICVVMYEVITAPPRINTWVCYDDKGVEIYHLETTQTHQIKYIGDNLFRTPEGDVMVGICDYSSRKGER